MYSLRCSRLPTCALVRPSATTRSTRQRDPVVRPLEKLNAQVLLELPHLLADGGLSDTETLGGAPEMELLGDATKYRRWRSSMPKPRRLHHVGRAPRWFSGWRVI
jgi:hypothetical protein